MVGGAGAYFAHLYAVKHANYSGSGTGEVTVLVRSGDTGTSLARELIRLGVIKAADPFIAAAKDSTNPTGLEPGFFRLHKHMNAALAYALLLNPKSRIQSKVTIPDGQRLVTILTTLSQETGIALSKFTAASHDTAALGLPAYAHGSLEGYLYPATYYIQPGTSALGVLQTMVNQFKTQMQGINLPRKAKAAQLTQGQVITVASLLEAEGGSCGCYSKIAQVIYNRLNTHMPLELDSTVLYALNKTGYLLTPSQLHVNSPYNTFIHKGLPPGPIDNPDQAAILAALHPTRGDWLYFVTVNPATGLTKFTDSAKVFARYEAECRKKGAC